MKKHRSSRSQWRTVAIAAAAGAAAIAVAVSLSGRPAPDRVAQAADVSQASASAVCTTSGPGGMWIISSAETATLAPAGTSAPGPCANISLPDAGQTSAIQQCANTLQAAQQQFEQESTNVLFKEFITNLIQNNASRWASALASQGYQGPAPSANSQQVSGAIDQVLATDSDLANAVAQALIGLAKHGFDTPVDCAAAESDPNWYSNAFQALADWDLPEQLVYQALSAVAGQIEQWAKQASAAFTAQPTPSNTPLQTPGQVWGWAGDRLPAQPCPEGSRSRAIRSPAGNGRASRDRSCA